MPNFCMVVNCGSTGMRDSVRFFRIPSVLDNNRRENSLAKERRAAWIQSLRREDLTDSKIKYGRICSKHFISGKPAELKDRNHPDWVPSVDMGYKSTNLSKDSTGDRYERLLKRKRTEICAIPQVANRSNSPQSNSGVQEDEHDILDPGTSHNEELESLRLEVQNLHIEKQKLQKKVQMLEFDVDNFKSDDNFTLYYTSFPEFAYVNAIFELIEDKLSTASALTKFKQFSLTLMKLRLNFPFKDLGYRFQIHHTTAARIFYKTIDVLYEKLKSLIIWPDRDDLRCNVPKCFEQNFGSKVTVIVDCFEVAIEKSSNPEAASKTWSNYKHHHTVKYLIGITPQGTISFISKAYGGRASDKFITEDCGILSNLLPGDLVLADRGFRIEDSVSLSFAQVVTPPFMKGKSQLTAKEVEDTRKIAAVRIHVERVIGLLRLKYLIFGDILPLIAVRKKDDEVSLIDKLIVILCCAFINISPGIVPLY